MKDYSFVSVELKFIIVLVSRELECQSIYYSVCQMTKQNSTGVSELLYAYNTHDIDDIMMIMILSKYFHIPINFC